MKRIPIWIDTDPGVDDAVALLTAHRLDSLEIIGVSTVAGNVPLVRTTHNALALRAFMGADFPVYCGADKPWLREYRNAEFFHGADGLGGATLPEPTIAADETAAWDALYEAAMRYAGELEVVTLGPMTNLAAAFCKYPQLPKLLKRVLFMGGAAVGGNCTPCAEYNIFTDPEAAQLVLRSGVPLVMCGLDVTEQAFLTEAEFASLAELPGATAQFVHAAGADLLRKNLAAGQGGWCLHDVCPILYAVQPSLFHGRKAGVFVETRAALTLGKTVADLCSDKKFDEQNVFVVLDIDRDAFVRAVFTVLQAV